MTNFGYVMNWDENGLGFFFLYEVLLDNIEQKLGNQFWRAFVCMISPHFLRLIFWSPLLLVAVQQSVSHFANHKPTVPPQSFWSSVRVKKGRVSCLLWNNANPFRRTICTVCSSFLQQLDRGGWDGAYTQADRWADGSHTIGFQLIPGFHCNSS